MDNSDPFYAVGEELILALTELRSLRGQVLLLDRKVQQFDSQMNELKAKHSQELDQAQRIMLAAQELYAEESLRADSLQREISNLGV